MESKEKEEILIAIAELRVKNEHLERYIYKELKPDIEGLCAKFDDCTQKTEECYRKNLRWMIATLLAFIAAGLSWAGVLLMKVI